jgi:hypothetical protein
MTTTTMEAQYIAPDTYAGRWTVRGTRRSDVFTAGELAEMAETMPDQTIVLWEFSGHVHGQPLYVRGRFVGQADGSLVGYDSNGARSIIHPADRKIRVITK